MPRSRRRKRQRKAVSTHGTRGEEAQPTASHTKTAAQWVFAEQRRTEGHSFGNAALYATPQDIPSLVRETGQNSLDAAGSRAVVMRYALFDLPHSSLVRKRFLAAIHFEDQLRPHIEAAARSEGERQTAVRLSAALREFDSPDVVLRVLRVEDYGASGLAGADFGASGAFCALVRDDENSQKSDQTAGGSFGLGAKTLWSCSKLLTVFFSSLVDGSESKGIRCIGKADLGFHQISGGASYGYQGVGFFGRSEDDGAASVWPTDRDFLSHSLLARKAPETAESEVGTTALIVGFEDPTSDDENSEQIVERLSRAVAEYFWPAILREQLVVIVEHHVGDEPAARSSSVIDPTDYVPSYVSAYRKHLRNEVKAKLEQPGDVVSVPVMLTIPATRPEGKVDPQHEEQTAECRLVIRLAEADAKDNRWTDHVGMARGRAMITRYSFKRGLAAGARPFHAVLLAGTLAGDGPPEVHAEKFLRYCEPPSHDDWKFSRGVKSRYAHGAGAKLEQFNEAISRALTEFVAVPSEDSEEGPEVLKRLLQLPNTPPDLTAQWRILEPQVEFHEDSVRVSATIQLTHTRACRLTPRVSIAKESGVAIRCDWRSLESGDAERTGNALLVEQGTRTISFEGVATPQVAGLQLDRCAVQITVDVSD